MPYDEIEAYLETPGMIALGAIPGVGVGMAFNQQRAGRTILSGVSTHGKYNNARGIRSSLGNTFGPRNFSRLGSYDAFYYSSGKYSPFAMASVGNAIANTLGMIPDAAKGNPAYADAKGRAAVFGPGTFARMGAMAKVGAGGTFSAAARAGFNFADYDTITSAAGRSTTVMNILTDPSSSWAQTGGGFKGYSQRADAAIAAKARIAQHQVDADKKLGSRVTSLHRMAGSVEGYRSQKLLNYYAGAIEGRSSARMAHLANYRLNRMGAVHGSQSVIRDLSRAGLDVVDGSLMRGGQKVGAKAAIMGAKSGTRLSAAKVLGARGLGATAGLMAGPFGTYATIAMLGYDLGQLAGAGIKGVINTIGDAAESLQGSMNKPIFGMGFKDTQFAATSRARGVMAIQNSRLNARSAMGSEAGMMAAHFG
jgi:hypothetical protein